jgi:hypothetical protein
MLKGERSSRARLMADWEWSSICNVSAPSGVAQDSWAPAAVVGTDGRVYAVWEERLASGHLILYTSVYSGTTWSVPEMGFIGEEPDLAVSPDGMVHLVYANEQSGRYDIFYTYWGEDGWEAPYNLSDTSGTSSRPAITAKGDGSLVAVWTDTTEGVKRIYHAWQQQGLWSTYLVTASSGGSAPDVTLGAGGRVWVGWQVLNEDSGYYDLYTIYGDGQSWIKYAMEISGGSHADSTNLQLAGVDDLGGFAVWQESLGEDSEIRYADTVEYVDYWTTSQCVSPGASRAERPALTADEAGNLHVTWEQGDNLWHRRRALSDEEWSPKAALSDGETAVDEPVLVSGPGYALHALWAEQVSGGDRDIHHRSATLLLPYELSLPVVLSP